MGGGLGWEGSLGGKGVLNIIGYHTGISGTTAGPRLVCHPRRRYKDGEWMGGWMANALAPLPPRPRGYPSEMKRKKCW